MRCRLVTGLWRQFLSPQAGLREVFPLLSILPLTMFTLYGYGHTILVGALLTLEVCFASLAVAVLLGMLGALSKLSPRLLLSLPAKLYTTVVRGIPDLVLMLIVFYGGQMAVNAIAEKIGHEEYIDVNPFIAGVLTIGFIFGAYMTETFRGAILAVNPGQLEAGRAYGMTGLQIFSRILLPQMMRHALPGFGNNWLVLTKATALVSIIGLNDMVQRASLAAGATHKPFVLYGAVAVNYLLLTTVSIILLKYFEKRYSAGFSREM
ncbi:MAG: ABC transporter permease [Desulforhopalus sp.]|nr:ABC transporter permease [Desulforhopalus sp.]